MSAEPRRIASRGRPERKPDPNVEAVKSAIQRIATLPEGHTFLTWLRNRTTFLIVGPDATDGALRAAEGKRQLMQEIESMIASGGRTDSQSE